jgi:hypothetical protein
LERLAGLAQPKKAELDRWFLEDVIDGKGYIEEMQRIGYSEKNIERYAQSITIAKKEKQGG